MENNKNASVGRRGFLKAVGATAVGGTNAIGPGVASGDSLVEAAAIPKRKLGKRGPELPILAYGGAGLPKHWGNPLSIEDRVKLVRYGFDRGVRMFDTAGNYMESASIMGEALKEVRRDAFLCSKVETTLPGQVRAAVERQLEQLKTDYLDACLIHGTPGLEQMTIPQAMKIHAQLAKLRDEGMIRQIGFSAHSYYDKAVALVDSGGFDLCMLAYGYLPRGHNQIFSERNLKLRDQCMTKAKEQGMGVIAMKVIGAGVMGGWAPYLVPEFDQSKVKDLPGAAIRYLLTDKRVDMLVIGMRLKSDIDENIATLMGDPTFTEEDRKLLADFLPKALASKAFKAMKVE